MTRISVVVTALHTFGRHPYKGLKNKLMDTASAVLAILIHQHNGHSYQFFLMVVRRLLQDTARFVFPCGFTTPDAPFFRSYLTVAAGLVVRETWNWLPTWRIHETILS